VKFSVFFLFRFANSLSFFVSTFLVLEQIVAVFIQENIFFDLPLGISDPGLFWENSHQSNGE